MRGNFLASSPARASRPRGPRVAGPARCGRRTKDLARRLKRGDIAIIDHRDLDSVAAQMLVEAGVAGVVNLSPSISGRYPNRGPSVLLEAGIPLLDVPDPSLMDRVREGTVAEIEGDSLRLDGARVAEGELQTPEAVERRLEQSRRNLDEVLQEFARNTLERASKELSVLVAPVRPPSTRAPIQGRHALIVVRGESYKQDLQIIRGYLLDVRPVLIGVDGGADALLEMGLRPDVIIGDMDSVSDAALRCGAEIVVHAYADGRPAPGEERVREMGLKYSKFAVPGTSEDAAMLFAFEHGAELIVAVGTHSNLFDFLEKGRGGMASTLLVRMRIGSRLVDAKGVSKLYPARRPLAEMLMLLLGALMLVTIIFQQSEPARAWLEMLGNAVRLKLLEWRILGQ